MDGNSYIGEKSTGRSTLLRRASADAHLRRRTSYATRAGHAMNTDPRAVKITT